jgi:hypothetical protein
MEATVPQVVDLPQGFVAVDEVFLTSDATGMPPGMLNFYLIAYGDPSALFMVKLKSPFFVMFELGLFGKADQAHTYMAKMMSLTEDEREAELWSVIGGVEGMEPDSLTIEEIEPVAGVGEEAIFIRARVYEKPSGGSDEFYLPRTVDIYTFRRDRAIGEVFLIWTPGPPGQQFVTENLAKKMDAGILQALPQLQALVP